MNKHFVFQRIQPVASEITIIYRIVYRKFELTTWILVYLNEERNIKKNIAFLRQVCLINVVSFLFNRFVCELKIEVPLLIAKLSF